MTGQIREKQSLIIKCVERIKSRDFSLVKVRRSHSTVKDVNPRYIIIETIGRLLTRVPGQLRPLASPPCCFSRQAAPRKLARFGTPGAAKRLL